MKNRKKDEVSDSCDDPDDNSRSSEKNGSHSEVSKHPKSLASGSDSDSENVSSANEYSKNKLSGEELPKTIHVGGVGHGESVSVQSTFNFEDLSSEDEIYTFQCPSSYKTEDLFDTTVDFTKPNQTVTTEAEEFQFELMNSTKKCLTLAVPKKSSSGTLINLPLKGHIIIQKVINTQADDLMIEDVHKKTKIVFPQDIKVRHPLLGVNWQDYIKIASEAIEKSGSKKNKNTKKEKATETKETEPKEELKKLKRKRCEDEPSIHKKRKKNKEDCF